MIKTIEIDAREMPIKVIIDGKRMDLSKVSELDIHLDIREFTFEMISRKTDFINRT